MLGGAWWGWGDHHCEVALGWQLQFWWQLFNKWVPLGGSELGSWAS